MAMTIPLTKGQVAIVDDDVYQSLLGRNWTAYYSRITKTYYATCSSKRKSLRMHRLILDAPSGMDVDHKNGDTLDNRRENLRIATRAQNCANRKRPVTNRTGSKCVFWRKDRSRYCVTLGVNGKRIYIGYFKSFEEARAAYEKAAMQYHGDFARIA